MKIKILKQKPAFTLIELLAVVFLIVIIAALLIPTGPHPSKSTTIMCLSNLRQLSLGSILFSEDHGGKYPWQTSVTNGGSLELIDKNLTYPHWLTLSNYALQPKLFVCPTDELKHIAPNFSEFGESNVSYFVNLDAVTNSVESVLAGDRHLQSSGVPVKPGLFIAKTNVSWSKELHGQNGSLGVLAFGDGHAVIAKQNVGTFFAAEVMLTNRLQVP
ncbi:MAG TPA: type II secretion system protein [Verrucomicrobiae bacterium]